MENFKIPGFYDNAHAPKVNALHLACARDAPPAVIIKLAALIPAATSKVDSKYKRTALHIAVLTAASCKTVKALILINPEAARTTDVFGRLPIHYACKEEKNGAANTRLLLNEFPLSTQVSDSNGFVPLHVACHAGASIGLVRNLLRADPTAAKIKTKRGATAVSCAKQSKGTQAEEILCVLQRL